MLHPDEHSLTYYALGLDSWEGERIAIAAHLEACCGCRGLVGELQTVYGIMEGLLHSGSSVEEAPPANTPEPWTSGPYGSAPGLHGAAPEPPADAVPPPDAESPDAENPRGPAFP